MARNDDEQLDGQRNADRDRNDADLPQRDAGGRRHASGPQINGRSFAGNKFASDEREQTADHRGENQRGRLDDEA